jgi:methionyl-tRNA synthetase
MESVIREECNSVHVRIDECMRSFEFAKAINAAFALVDQANKYLADEKPWSQFKEGKGADAEKVLYTCLEVLRRVAMYIYPFTPSLSAAIWDQLGYDGKIEEFGKNSDSHGYFDLIPAGQTIRNKGPIFKRFE